MRRARAAVLEAATHADDPHRQTVEHGPVPDELVGPQHCERDDRIAKRDEAGFRETGGDTDHVLLGDAHVEETVGEPVAERFEGHEPEVARQQDDALVALGFLDERANEGSPHARAPISRMACSYSSSDIGR